MKLTDEERNSLVILQFEKAKVFLKQADEMFGSSIGILHLIDNITLVYMQFKSYKSDWTDAVFYL